ncbi:MAG: hypothetical protein HQK77_13375 [Desulfobacterales bacterium]|nr:hypothetical protein [Desulfobacterales bacterium]
MLVEAGKITTNDLEHALNVQVEQKQKAKIPASTESTSIRVDITKLDKLLNLVGEVQPKNSLDGLNIKVKLLKFGENIFL